MSEKIKAWMDKPMDRFNYYELMTQKYGIDEDDIAGNFDQFVISEFSVGRRVYLKEENSEGTIISAVDPIVGNVIVRLDNDNELRRNIYNTDNFFWMDKYLHNELGNFK